MPEEHVGNPSYLSPVAEKLGKFEMDESIICTAELYVSNPSSLTDDASGRPERSNFVFESSAPINILLPLS